MVHGADAVRLMGCRAQEDGMEVVIVRRGEFSTFALLSRAFADDAAVRLVWDRRVDDRQTVACGVADSRQPDRRRPPPTGWGHQHFMLVNTADDYAMDLQKGGVAPGTETDRGGEVEP
jgi:hypothetical protein